MDKNSDYIEKLAKGIEEFMYVRGEYDFDTSEQIRWIQGHITEDMYAKRHSPVAWSVARVAVKNCIKSVLDGSAPAELGGIEPLISYLQDQLVEMSEDDDLIPKVEGFLQDLANVERLQQGLSF